MEGNTSPPFKTCGACGGDKLIWRYEVTANGEIGEGECLSCEVCNGTGRIPIYYTIPQWEELTGRKVPDDMPVWVLQDLFQKVLWHQRIGGQNEKHGNR